MGSKSSKSCATENMQQIKDLDINEKTKTDVLSFNTLKDVIERVEKLETLCLGLRGVVLRPTRRGGQGDTLSNASSKSEGRIQRQRKDAT